MNARHRHLIATLLVWPFILLASAAAAQVAVFDPDDYGQTDLLFKESTGDAGAFIAEQDGAFEPIRELPETDPIRRLAASIGRLDLVFRGPDGTSALYTCTGALLQDGWVLTNHHCIPDAGDQQLVEASILLGYLAFGDTEVRRYALSTAPSEWSATLDFSLVRLLESPDPAFGALTLRTAPVTPGESLFVIHHPLGRPQVMTRFRCFAIRAQVDGPIIRHSCDTQPGSSGALLFDRELHPVALHHSGGMTPNDSSSFNQSTRLSDIIAQSPALAALAVAPTGMPADQPDAAQPMSVTELSAPSGNGPDEGGGLGVGGINDLLKGN